MKQSDLNRAVARATGESITTIQRLGFMLADPADILDADAEEHGPYVINWDELAAQRHIASAGRPSYEPAAV